MHESQTKLRECNSQLLAILDKLPDWCAIEWASIYPGKPTISLSQKSFLRLFSGREAHRDIANIAIDEPEARYIASNYMLWCDDPPRTYTIPVYEDQPVPTPGANP